MKRGWVPDLISPESASFAALFGLGGAIAWGVADFLGAVASKANDAAHAAAAVQLIGAVLFASAYALLLGAPEHRGASGAVFAAGAGVFIALGLLAFYKGLEAGPVSVVSPVGSAYPLVTTSVAVALFAAQPTGLQVLGVGMIVLGVIACSGIAEARTSGTRLSRGVRFASCTLFLWGVAFALLDEGVDRLGWETSTLIQLAAAATTFLLLLGADRAWWMGLPTLIRSPYVAGAGVITLAGTLSVNLGLTSLAAGDVAIVTAVSSCYPALTIVLALRHLGEEVRVISLSGAGLTTVGVVVVSLA